MKVSIVTISYNQANFLEQAILSVINQDYHDIEYIIVDPGSTDNSSEIIEQYREQVDKIITEPDTGPAEGLNNGFAHATGDIYSFVNSDDYLLPGAIRAIVSAFQARPFKDVLSGNALIVDRAGTTLKKFYSRKFSAQRAVYGAATLPQQATFFRAQCFRKSGGFNPSNHIAWDGEFWIDMALCGCRFGRIKTFLAAFRLHQESITYTKHISLEHYRYLESMFRKVQGRDSTFIDNVIRVSMKGLEYLENPLMLADRLLHGREIKTGIFQKS